MMEMSWDDELAHIAQRWANQCQGEDHDTCRDVKRFHVGQNMAQEGDMELKFEANHADLINMWYDEVVYVDSSLVDSYTGKA
ncbi:venom allergen 5 isoform X2 [Anabrus simplex]|uniref:venom allergen 5 isoform X2 n=1 Tax=Anabrus simplex TaxID=316456 RepID=UPI0034DD2DB9